MRNAIISLFIVGSLFFSCNSHTELTNEDAASKGRVPVTIVKPATVDIADVVELNATSVFLSKTGVKAPVSGYLKEVNAALGTKIGKGKKMFVIQTKEAASLGNALTRSDSSLRFNGRISLSSSCEGFITQLNYRVGDYVQEGETLAEISNVSSQVFLLNLPYELTPYLPLNRTVKLRLPDGKVLKGLLKRPLPMVDPVSQTQQYVIEVSTQNSLPENLIASVSFVKAVHKKAFILPKEAVVTNETQSEFWVMKMIDSITAVKVPVKKGLETDDMVEILSPKLLPSERILLTGNYGLPDTALVSISTGKK